MPLLLAVLTKVQGKSQIVETIFSNRFMAAPELKRMGAKIRIKKNKAIIIGQKKLNFSRLYFIRFKNYIFNYSWSYCS